MKNSGGEWPYAWTDDAKVTYTNWADDMPDSTGGCACMANMNVNSRWMNVDCSERRNFVCKLGKSFIVLLFVLVPGN